MTLTNKQEELLILIAQEREAFEKLNKENLVMGNAIRLEFKTIDERIRAEHKSSTDTLLDNLNRIKNLIKERF